jgi:glycosyltransferase involved in cell wall biosynthesis
MKILHTVESYYPEISGMAEVVKQLSERLVALGHEVTVVTRKIEARKSTLINGVKIKEFNIQGNWVNGITGDTKEYEAFLLRDDYDILTNFACQQWMTDVALPLLLKLKAKKVFVPTGLSGLLWDEYNDYYEQMKTWMHAYDMTVFLSNNYMDINFARKIGITKKCIIPNGAGADEFLRPEKINIRKKLGIPETDFFILHVGTYTGVKGHAEAIRIYLKSKIKKGVMVFIAFKHKEFIHYTKFNKRFFLWKLLNFFPRKKIIITLLDREETVAALKAADLFFFPSQIECSPIVLFEAMAGKTSFLSTDVGNVREIIEWSNGGEILPTFIDDKGFSHAQINESAEQLNALYTDVSRRDQLAQQGFQAWKKKFSWEIIAKQYEQLYLNLLMQQEK